MDADEAQQSSRFAVLRTDYLMKVKHLIIQPFSEVLYI